MRNLILTLALVSISSTALAQSRLPALLTKESFSGYTLEEHAFSKRCDVYRNKIVITNSNGATKENSVSLTREIPIVELSQSVYNLIHEASRGEIEKGAELADAGQTTYRAYELQPNDAVVTVDLKGKGSRNFTNKSKQARILVNFLDAVCP